MALVVAFREAEEFGIERVGEIFAERGGAGDSDGGEFEGSAVAIEELLPGFVAAESAGASEDEIGELKREIELFNLCGRGLCCCRKAEVMFRAEPVEDRRKFGFCETDASSFGGAPEVVEKRGGNLCGLSCHGVGRWQIEREFAGLWRGGVHVIKIRRDGGRRSRKVREINCARFWQNRVPDAEAG